MPFARLRTIALAIILSLGFVEIASAYYNPRTGRFLSRDPIGEPGFRVVQRAVATTPFIPRDSIATQSNSYRYVRNHPTIAVDPLGLQESQPATSQCCDYCGPDMTEFTRKLIKNALQWRSQQPSSIGIRQRWRWMKNNGMSFDWWSEGRGDYRIPGRCPSGDKCRNTYWICDTCVHDHWIGNMMYGLIGRLLGFWEHTLNEAGDSVQGPGVGDNPIWRYYDPPWDRGGYEIGYGIYNATHRKGDPPNLQSDQQFCDFLRGTLGRHWTNSYKTFIQERPSEGWAGQPIRYPTPHALWDDYKDCQKCPYALPKEKLDALPGGGFPNGFPGV